MASGEASVSGLPPTPLERRVEGAAGGADMADAGPTLPEDRQLVATVEGGAGQPPKPPHRDRRLPWSGSGEGGVPSKQQQLLYALEKRDLARFQSILNEGGVQLDYRYNESNNRVGTCLEIACRWQGMGKFVKLLLEKGDPNVNHIRMEPIHHAARHANADALGELLADHRTRIYARDVSGRTALHQAFLHVKPPRIKAHLECVQLLMERYWRSALNRVDNHGYTAVHLAVLGEGAVKRTTPAMSTDEVEARRRLVEKLLELGHATIDLDTARPNGTSAREDILQKYPDLKQRLPDRSVRRDAQQGLVDAMQAGDIDLFKELLRRTRPDGGPVFDPGHWFGAPLHASCLEMAAGREGAAAFVAALLEAGADPNVANRLTGTYPVHEAAKQGLADNLRALLENGKTEVNPNCTDKLGNTAMHYAVEVGNVVEDNQEKGENREVNTDRNLHINKMKCLRKLLELDDINIHIRNRKKQRPLDVAKACGNKAAESLLGATLECLTREQRSDAKTLIYYLKNKQLPQFKRLLKTTKDKPGIFTEEMQECGTVLQYAARYGPKQAVSCLLEAGADPNAVCSKNKTPPLVLASQYDRPDIVKKFLNPRWERLDVNVQDPKGNTALHYRVRENCLESVVRLLSFGADPTRTNNLGKYALDEPNAKSFLDQCVRDNKELPQSENYEIVFDYRFLVALSKSQRFAPQSEGTGAVCCKAKDGREAERIPMQPLNQEKGARADGGAAVIRMYLPAASTAEPRREMELLETLSRYEKKDILEHPIASSFHALKWEKMKNITYLNLIIYFVFVVCLNIYIMFTAEETEQLGLKTNVTSQNVETGKPEVSNFTTPLSYVLLLLASYILGREIIQIIVDFRRYYKNYENYLDLFLPFVTIWKIAYPSCPYASWLDVITIMASCIELLLMISRVSNFAKYIHMLVVVLKAYFYITVPYAAILLAFALSFHRVFARISATTTDDNITKRFSTFPMSFVKVIVMMSGEFEAANIPLEETALGVLLFVVFVALVAIVLLNLLIALAVTDTQAIKQDANLLWLETRVRVLTDIENIAIYFARKFPSVAFFKRVLLFPGDLNTQVKEAWVCPNGEAILKLRMESAGPLIQSGEAAKVKKRKVKQKIIDRARKILSERQSLNAESQEDIVAKKIDSIFYMVSRQSGCEGGCAPPPDSPILDRGGSVPPRAPTGRGAFGHLNTK